MTTCEHFDTDGASLGALWVEQGGEWEVVVGRAVATVVVGGGPFGLYGAFARYPVGSESFELSVRALSMGQVAYVSSVAVEPLVSDLPVQVVVASVAAETLVSDPLVLMSVSSVAVEPLLSDPPVELFISGVAVEALIAD